VKFVAVPAGASWTHHILKPRFDEGPLKRLTGGVAAEYRFAVKGYPEMKVHPIRR